MLLLKDIGENALIERLTQGLPQTPRTLTGPGDDCAVLDTGNGQGCVFKTDCIVEGVHFLAETPGEWVGRKAVCRGLSDIAAMGATPQEAVITLGAPADTPVARAEAIYAGIRETATLYGLGIAGGETVSVPVGSRLFINVALLGRIDLNHVLRRSTARAGDVIFVTGELGNTLAGHHLHFEPRLAAGQWLANDWATAAMDLSDGLAKDLPRLAAASLCGYALDVASLPCRNGCTPQQALGDGEDYELLFTCHPSRTADLETAWQLVFPEVRLTKIGHMAALGMATELKGGWEHF